MLQQLVAWDAGARGASRLASGTAMIKLVRPNTQKKNAPGRLTEGYRGSNLEGDGCRQTMKTAADGGDGLQPVCDFNDQFTVWFLQFG